MEPLSLKQYIKELTALYKIYGNLPLCYASDEEGNNFSELYIGPSEGTFVNYSFTALETPNNSLPVTHICIN